MHEEMSFKHSFRTTKQMHEEMKKKCEETGLSMSAYIRALVEKRQKVLMSREDRIQKAELIMEINKIGVNINQIVKNVNSYFYSEKEKRQLFEMMEKLEKLLAEKL